MLYYLVSHSSSGTFDIAYYKRVCARCMSNAVEEFLAIFLRIRGRLIAATAEINEQKRKKREREREREREQWRCAHTQIMKQPTRFQYLSCDNGRRTRIAIAII